MMYGRCNISDGSHREFRYQEWPRMQRHDDPVLMMRSS